MLYSYFTLRGYSPLEIVMSYDILKVKDTSISGWQIIINLETNNPMLQQT